MPTLAVTAIGADQPGIVAAVSAALVERGCNLEDTSMSILRGQFAMVLIVDAPSGVTATDLEADLVAATAALQLVVSVRDVADVGSGGGAAGDQGGWTVVVYGADHPGIVHGITSVLAGLAANVVDLATRVIGGADRPVYAMLLDVTLPAGVGADGVEARLDEVCGDLGVEWSLHPSDADVL